MSYWKREIQHNASFLTLRFSRQKLPCQIAMNIYCKFLNDFVTDQSYIVYEPNTVCRSMLGEGLV